MTSYSEKLRHPLWQKKRLEILSRDNWTCQHCRKKDITLNVHHNSYAWGVDPWDYDDSNFVTLCENCHDYENKTLKQAKKILKHEIDFSSFTSISIQCLAHSFSLARRKFTVLDWMNLGQCIITLLENKELRDSLSDDILQGKFSCE